MQETSKICSQFVAALSGPCVMDLNICSLLVTISLTFMTVDTLIAFCNNLTSIAISLHTFLMGYILTIVAVFEFLDGCLQYDEELITVFAQDFHTDNVNVNSVKADSLRSIFNPQ